MKVDDSGKGARSFRFGSERMFVRGSTAKKRHSEQNARVCIRIIVMCGCMYVCMYVCMHMYMQQSDVREIFLCPFPHEAAFDQALGRRLLVVNVGKNFLQVHVR